MGVCAESMFFFYFMLRRFLPGNPSHTPTKMVELSPCWDASITDALSLQWLYLRIGYALFQVNSAVWRPPSLF